MVASSVIGFFFYFIRVKRFWVSFFLGFLYLLYEGFEFKGGVRFFLVCI